MADDRIIISSEPSMAPEEISRRSFATGFRGYDTGEVRAFLRRAAQELTAAHERERELRGRYEEARQRAAHPHLDEETLTAALGDEAARLIRSAREVSADIQTKAEQKVARMVKEAQEEATRLKSEAEAVLTRRTEEAEAAATGLRDAAKAEADALRDAARAEAAAEIEAAKARGREIVIEAQALRERLLGDLARRRKLGLAQVEQLRAGRDRLLDAYRVVRRTLDEVTEELTVAENEARVAAEAAARRTAADAEATLEQLEAEIAAEKADAAPAAEAEPEREPEPVAEVAPAAPVLSLVDLTEAPEVIDLTTAEEPPETPAPAMDDAGVDDEQEDVDAEDSAPAVEADRPAPGLRILRDTPPPDAPAAGDVDELFARIKADRAQAVARAEQVLTTSPVTTLAPAAQQSAAQHTEAQHTEARPTETDEPVPDDVEQALQRRDEALEPIDTVLVRKLKRALQDEQNEVLEALRTTRGKPAPDAVLPDEAKAKARYRDVALPLLRDAAAAGAAFAGGQMNGLDLGPLADDLAEELVVPLRDRLVRNLEEAVEAEDEQAVIAERIGAGYREWKVQRVERAARDRAAAAFARGSYAALDDDALVRWVVDDEGGPCPDCDDDALAGPVRKGDAFPTGQQHPPAHAGCRCLLVPASA